MSKGCFNMGIRSAGLGVRVLKVNGKRTVKGPPLFKQINLKEESFDYDEYLIQRFKEAGILSESSKNSKF